MAMILSERELRLVLMLLLEEEPTHGYSLSQQITEQLNIKSSITAVYRALRKLEVDGLVSQTISQASKGPQKRIFHLTPAGRQQLDQAIAVQRQLAVSFDSLIVARHPVAVE